ncbi:nucleoid-associated protein [Asaia bogorensis]|uniref:nucleoid-associated protein n=1 Tax=Asaia bogorensis TaxID=91915 RepID=UPI0013C466DC|nr:nucleoid-associated protein [Asaia bogorensis]
MTDSIFNVAIHHLKRDDDNNYGVHKGNGQLTVGPTAKRLIDDLHKHYARRPSKSYGKFSEDVSNYPTSLRISEYFESKVSFEHMTMALMSTLAKEAQARSASEGGHVFFAHFGRDEKQYILVAIVNDKVSAALTDKEELQDVTHLDADGYRFAGRVSIEGWKNNEERYVSFLKGKGNVSEYFMAFLGCETASARRIDTTNMVNAIKEFADSQRFSSDERARFMDKTNNICIRESKAEKPVNFATLANELYPQEPETLVAILADPDRGLIDGFVVDRRALRGLVSFKRKTANWAVEFEREALHSDKVRYSAEMNSITLFDVPDDLRRELLAEQINDE